MKRIFKFIIHAVMLLILLGVLALAYAFYVEPQILITKEHDMEVSGAADKTNGETYKLLQISDLHMGEGYSEAQLDRVVKKVNREAPDILVCTGDLYDNYSVENNDQMVVDKLSQMKAKCGKFAVWGNRDYGGGAVRHYAEIMRQSGFRLLKNEAEQVLLPNGRTIAVGGLDDWLFGAPDQAAVSSQMKGADYQVLLMHEPDAADQLKDQTANLILTGHSHGGQIRLPLVNVVTTRLARKYTSGFYAPAGSSKENLYVNTGLGTTRIHARFLVPPQIDVFHIQF